MNHCDILIFKTNIRSAGDLKKVRPVLDAHPSISRWNVDTGDIDKVLRIESTALTVDDVNALILQTGFHCEELQD